MSERERATSIGVDICRWGQQCMGQHGPSIWALTKKTGRNHLSSYFELMGLGRLTAYLSLRNP